MQACWRLLLLAWALTSLFVLALPSASTCLCADTRFGGLVLGNDEPASGYLLAARGIKHAIPESRLGHIFRNAPGHIPDTPANRALLQNVADDAATTLGVDKWGNTWSARTLDNGTQVWTQTRGGQIVNGGLNEVPRVFSPDAGLVPPVPGGF
jgi:hypothetical protein